SSVDPGGNKTAMTAGAGMPRWLLMVRNIFFAHPSKGAEVLLSAALEGVKFTSGSFIGKGKAVPLPHMQSAALMLDMVDQIYRKEYAML
ncbi:MAG TPA: hypothetical protein VL947_06950, partial [Cytophagales bacterium]|nr:hypothetical protein [Cytophagales bacterium]